MTSIASRAWCLLWATLLVLATAPHAAVAQQSNTAAMAKELATLLEQKSLDSIAAKEQGQQDHYIAALFFKGSQLLAVEARYSVPLYVNQKLDKKDYREVYIDLNSASIPESKVLIVDMRCDGISATREENQSFDTYETATARVQFDGDWKKQKMTEDQYMKAFAEAEVAYLTILKSLIAEAKK